MAEELTPPSPDDRLMKRASEVCKQLVAKAIGRDVLVEHLTHGTAWTDLRRTFNQHMSAFSYLSNLTVVVDATGQLAGWKIDRRADTGVAVALPAVPAEKLARMSTLITSKMRCEAVEKVETGPEKSYTKCVFAAPAVGRQPAVRYEVAVNSIDGQIISVLPPDETPTKPLTLTDDKMKQAQTVGFTFLRDEFQRKGATDAAKNIADAIRLTPKSGAEERSGRRRYVFAVWNFYSECDVALDAANEQVLSWTIEAMRTDKEPPAGQPPVDNDVAVNHAKPELLARQEVAGPKVEPQGHGAGQSIMVHWWHKIGELVVEADHTTVMVNAVTGKPFSMARKWRDIPKTLLEPKGIPADQAMALADEERRGAGVPEDAKGKVIEKAIIEVPDNPHGPSGVRNYVAWRVGYRSPTALGHFWELDIEHVGGKLVRVTGW